MTVLTSTPDDGGYDLGNVVIKGAANTADLREALSDWPKITRGIDSAATLTLQVDDHHRTLVASPMFDGASFADYNSLRFELVAVAKGGDTLTLTFEDSLAQALRRQKAPLTIPAGTQTRGAILERLMREAGVPFLIEPRSGVVQSAVERKDDGDSWDLSGELADAVGWRRFSDGVQVVCGSDPWLATLNPTLTMREFTDFVHTIDWDLDVAQPANRATVEIDAAGWVALPGQPVRIVGQGLADGLWLIDSMDRTEGITRQNIGLIRRQLVLAEPEPDDRNTADAGEAGNLAYTNGSTGTATSGTAEQFVQAALSAARGKPYVWGASGPNSFDCSGLVQFASAKVGRRIGKPAAAQWSATKGRSISLADAYGRRGALLFRIGRGSTNHVAISLGNGSTVEARGKAQGCGVFGNAKGRAWTGASFPW